MTKPDQDLRIVGFHEHLVFPHRDEVGVVEVTFHLNRPPTSFEIDLGSVDGWDLNHSSALLVDDVQLGEIEQGVAEINLTLEALSEAAAKNELAHSNATHAALTELGRITF